MGKEIMEVTRTQSLEAATPMQLFELDAQFVKLHKTCVDEGWDLCAVYVQEHIKEINLEIFRRFNKRNALV